MVVTLPSPTSLVHNTGGRRTKGLRLLISAVAALLAVLSIVALVLHARQDTVRVERLGFLAAAEDALMRFTHPPAWSKHVDKENGRTYYWNEITHTSQWNAPPGLGAAAAGAERGGTQYKSKGASGVHTKSTTKLRERSNAGIALSQMLTPGEHVEAVSTLLLNRGGLVPMKSGEQATVLRVNTASGVDTIITTDGKEGKFPNSDLAPDLAGGDAVSQLAADEVVADEVVVDESERKGALRDVSEETSVSKSPRDGKKVSVRQYLSMSGKKKVKKTGKHAAGLFNGFNLVPTLDILAPKPDMSSHPWRHGWRRHVDKENGRTYFFNRITRVSQWNPPPGLGWRTNINRKFAAAQKKEEDVVKEYKASAAKKEEEEKEEEYKAAASKNKEGQDKAAATGGGRSAQLAIADQELALQRHANEINAPQKQVQSLSDDSDECKECCAEDVPKKKDCPCCQPKEVLIEFRIPMTCSSFTPEAQESFKCAIAEQAGNDDCSTVTIPALDCPAEEPPREEEKCDCCNDHARRRLLWADFECPCCKTKSLAARQGHAAWSSHRTMLAYVDALTKSLKVDASVATTAGKASTVLNLLSNPDDLNKALESAGLPPASVLRTEVLDPLPPLSVRMPHHDYMSWKDSQGGHPAWIGDWEHPRLGKVKPDTGSAKLHRLGVNVYDDSALPRAVPVPQFDETQWDHFVTHGPKQITWENGHAYHDVEDRDSGHRILNKLGVHIGDDGRHEVADKSLVHTLFGYQTKTSYFSDDNEIYQPMGKLDYDQTQRAKLVKVGLNVDDIAGVTDSSHTYTPNSFLPKIRPGYPKNVANPAEEEPLVFPHGWLIQPGKTYVTSSNPKDT